MTPSVGSSAGSPAQTSGSSFQKQFSSGRSAGTSSNSPPPSIGFSRKFEPRSASNRGSAAGQVTERQAKGTGNADAVRSIGSGSSQSPRNLEGMTAGKSSGKGTATSSTSASPVTSANSSNSSRFAQRHAVAKGTSDQKKTLVSLTETPNRAPSDRTPSNKTQASQTAQSSSLRRASGHGRSTTDPKSENRDSSLSKSGAIRNSDRFTSTARGGGSPSLSSRQVLQQTGKGLQSLSQSGHIHRARGTGGTLSPVTRHHSSNVARNHLAWGVGGRFLPYGGYGHCLRIGFGFGRPWNWGYGGWGYGGWGSGGNWAWRNPWRYGYYGWGNPWGWYPWRAFGLGWGFGRWGGGYGGYGGYGNCGYNPDCTYSGSYGDYGYSPVYYASAATDPNSLAVATTETNSAPVIAQNDPSSLSSSTEFADRGEQEFKAGNYDKAAGAWRHALVDDPKNGVVMMMLSQALFAVGKFDEAAGTAQQGMLLLPEDNWGVVPQNYKELYANIGDYSKQLKALEAARKEKPDDPALRFLLGYHYGYLGYPTEAVRELDRGLSIAPQDKLAFKMRSGFKKQIKPQTTEVPPPVPQE